MKQRAATLSISGIALACAIALSLAILPGVANAADSAFTRGYGDKPITKYSTCEVSGPTSQHITLSGTKLTVTQKGKWSSKSVGLKVGTAIAPFTNGSATVTLDLSYLENVATPKESVSDSQFEMIRIAELSTLANGGFENSAVYGTWLRAIKLGGKVYIAPNASYLPGDGAVNGASRNKALVRLLNKKAKPSDYLDYTVNRASATMLASRMTAAQAAKVKKAAQNATAGCTSQSQKAAALLYEWFPKHVKYNYRQTGNVADQQAWSTFKNGTGVCGGIVNLYVSMCRSIGIPALVVNGTASGGMHSWAAVYLEGSWRFVEPTAVVVSDGPSGKQNAQQLGVFCASPELFGMAHLAFGEAESAGEALKEILKTNSLSQPIKLTAKSKTLKAKAVAKKSRTFKLIKATGAKGKLTYMKYRGSKQISINKKTGKVTVKKGTEKGTYAIGVRVKAAKKGAYKATTVTKLFQIKVV